MNKIKYFTIFKIGIALLIASCNTDNQVDTLESNLIGGKNFNITSTQIPISIENQKLTAVQGNYLKMYALGEVTQKQFGNTKAQIISQLQLPVYNPTFGKLSAAEEEKNNSSEEETVEKVYLYLPFYSKKQNNTYVLDSIYGEKTSSFNLQVSVLEQQLRDINEKYTTQIYFSTDSFQKGETIGQAQINGLSNTPITRYEFDNPQTAENESEKIRDVLAPALKVELSKDFFQKQILDKEGKYELSNFMLFSKHIKGLIFQVENLSAPLLMYIDLSNAKVVIEYSYTNEQKQEKALFELPLITQKEEKTSTGTYVTQQGIAINTFENQAISTFNEHIYLQGQQGYVAQITLEENTIKQLQEKADLVNQAKLTLYVDESLSDTKKLPEYLTLLNTKTNSVLPDFTDATSLLSRSIGKLQKDEKGYYYDIKLTDHMSNIIRQKAENVKLTLAITEANSTDNFLTNKGKTSQGEISIPRGSIQSPKAVVLHLKTSSLVIQYTQRK